MTAGTPRRVADAVRPAGVLRNASVLAAATLIARLLGFALAIVMARALGSEEYGRYSLALALGQILIPVADLGLTPYLGREAARSRAGAEARLRTLLKVKLGLMGGTLLLTVLVSLLVLDDRALVVVLVTMVAATMADTFSSFAYGYFQGRESMGFEARTTATTAVARGVGGILLVLLVGDLWVIVAWILGTSLLQASFVAVRLRATAMRPPVRANGDSRVDARAVVSMGLMGLFVFAYLRIDSLLIGVLIGEDAVGQYAAAYTIMLGAQIVPWMLSTALTPVFARTWSVDRAAFQSTWQRGARAVLLVALPVAVGGTVLADELIARVFGAEYASAASALAVLVWACPLGAFGMIVQSTIRAAGREGWLVWVSGGCVVFNVLANLWVIPRHGITGAAVVTIATEAFSAMLLAIIALRRGILEPLRIPAVRVALALLALAAASALGATLVVELGLVLGAAVYAGAVLALRVSTVDELKALRSSAAVRQPPVTSETTAPP
jgi:O-antigen/teichoic acid export membrane protein